MSKAVKDNFQWHHRKCNSRPTGFQPSDNLIWGEAKYTDIKTQTLPAVWRTCCCCCCCRRQHCCWCCYCCCCCCRRRRRRRRRHRRCNTTRSCLWQAACHSNLTLPAQAPVKTRSWCTSIRYVQLGSIQRFFIFFLSFGQVRYGIEILFAVQNWKVKIFNKPFKKKWRSWDILRETMSKFQFG